MTTFILTLVISGLAAGMNAWKMTELEQDSKKRKVAKRLLPFTIVLAVLTTAQSWSARNEQIELTDELRTSHELLVENTKVLQSIHDTVEASNNRPRVFETERDFPLEAARLQTEILIEMNQIQAQRIEATIK